jgi:hypothetical protein
MDLGSGRLGRIAADFLQAIRLTVRQAHDKSFDKLKANPPYSGLFRGLLAVF